MKEIFLLIKEIFMFNNESSDVKVGLSQFKTKKIEQPVKKVVKVQKEVKLSDLMRRSA